MKETREIIPAPIREPNEIERPFEPQIVTAGHYPAYHGGYVDTNTFQLLDYWRAIRKRLWLVIGIVVLVTTASAIYMARKPNIYQADAIVQVDLEQMNPDLVTAESKRPLSNPDPAYFNTQLQLLASDSLLRRVVKEHSLDTNKEFQAAKTEGSVSPLRAVLKAVGLASDAPKRTSDTTDQGDSSLAVSDEVAEAVRLAPYVDAIKRSLSVEPIRESRATVKDTRLIQISFKHTDPQLAAFVVNGIAETFVNMNQEKRSGTSRKTSDFLGKRIAELQTDIKADETKLVELKKKEGILPTSDQGTIDLDRLSGLNRQLLEAENQRKNAEAQYFAVKDNPDSIRELARQQMAQFISERENSLRDLRNETQKKISDLNAEKSKRLLDFKEGAPEIKEIDRQIDSLESSLAAEVTRNSKDIRDFEDRATTTILSNLQIKYAQAKQQEDKIRASFDEQYNRAQGQNEGAVLLKLLEQNIDTNKGFLKNLIEQQSGNDVASQGSDNNISVSEIAIPPENPVSPRRLMTVAAAMFLSTLFGMGLALFLEYLDDTIRTTEEIESYLQLPALAAIPTIDSMPRRRLLLVGNGGDAEEDAKANSELLINNDPRSSLAEAYRQLRTSILLSTAGHAPKSLLVTSSLPSEGKTTTATNTAISLAQTGGKVLLIDADMRRPRLHAVFNIQNGVGLSTLLSNEISEAEALNAIKFEPGTKLNLLTSGPIPPNPAELIGSEQMADLLKIFQNNFTHVVVDSPPIASFTDGVLIASMVDGVILVVNSGRISRQVVRRTRQLLIDVGAKIFGVVLNNVNLKSQDGYYYQSYYHKEYYRDNEESV